MTGYHGFVQSIIRRGIDAYQITLGICPADRQGSGHCRAEGTGDNLLIYRADITIEDKRTILFPDRELSKCMDAFHNLSPADAASDSLETRRMVGRIAARICGEVSNLLLERVSPPASFVSRNDAESHAAHN